MKQPMCNKTGQSKGLHPVLYVLSDKPKKSVYAAATMALPFYTESEPHQFRIIHPNPFDPYMPATGIQMGIARAGG